MKRCPCCGYLTIDDSYEVITDICAVCFWQYDVVSQDYPDISIGPNKVSLNMARENYKAIGACEEDCIGFGGDMEPDDFEKREKYKGKGSCRPGAAWKNIK